MYDPLDKHPEDTSENTFWNVSPEKLESMSPSELADAMELALDSMTEETYDPAVIDAYLDALDKKTPMPAHPSVTSSYQGFQQKLQNCAGQGASNPVKRTIKLRRIIRVGFAAALLAMLLAGAAQAAGIDVVGAIARWTESVFSFGIIQPNSDSSHNPSVNNVVQEDIPEEYQQLLTEFERQGIKSYTIPTFVPEYFQIGESELHADETRWLEFAILYVNEDESIAFAVSGNQNKYTNLYEKDGTEVSIYSSNGVDYFLFKNNALNTAAWIFNGLEYSIWTTLPVSDLEEIVDAMYICRE